MAGGTLLDPPGPAQYARFAEGFGQRSLLTINAEQEFDWHAPFSSTGYGLSHVSRFARFQEFCEGLGVIPVYLVDWPVATSRVAKDLLGDAVRAGRAEMGIQLHPWVNPPIQEEVNDFNSFAGNLPPELERKKFIALQDVIEENFGVAPLIYRAGHYGVGPQTSELLKDRGVAIDSSVRSRFDYRPYSGPDFSHHPATPYWSDNERQLLELPLTTVYWGMLRKQGPQLYPLMERMPRLSRLFSRLGLLERICLTPEGVPLEQAVRAIDMAVDDGLPLLVLSFHSPSLAPGHTPYVRTEDDLDALYGWLRGVYAYLDHMKVRPTSIREIMQSVIV